MSQGDGSDCGIDGDTSFSTTIRGLTTLISITQHSLFLIKLKIWASKTYFYRQEFNSMKCDRTKNGGTPKMNPDVMNGFELQQIFRIKTLNYTNFELKL